MTFAILTIIVGLALLVWSADRFVEGATGVAQHYDMPPLLIGMLIVGFGTSAPEMVVSILAAVQGNPGIALGNAYGSNIANIALILGLTALISPIVVQSKVLRKELPILAAATALSAYLIWDKSVGRADGWILIGSFALFLTWSIREGLRHKSDAFAADIESELETKRSTLGNSLLWLGLGFLVLVASSRMMVWGSVEIATAFGVSDLVIGLTIIAIGTSLPELASSISAARKGEHEMVIGNVIGSNLMNTLVVVGLAATINPMAVQSVALSRDVLSMSILTLSLFALGYRRAKNGRINQLEGAALLAAYIGYYLWLFASAR